MSVRETVSVDAAGFSLRYLYYVANAVKDLYAKRIPKNNRYVTAFFPTNVSAIQFVNGWSNGPAPGYEKVTAVFSSGN
ncbi:hypothetical protein B0H14DRAFT_3502398 [Mycena olivaceomarginata]|nr:hypothetical protein B0H14DRAFT_3502398 [Mycena olivaceomarginata]